MREEHVNRLKELKGRVLMWKFAGTIGPGELPPADVYYQMRSMHDDMPADLELAMLQNADEPRLDAAKAGYDPCDVILFDKVVYKGAPRAVLFTVPGAHFVDVPAGGFYN